MVLSGFYRAFVVAVDDPTRRSRVRVRVPQIHHEDVPDSHLPWAEIVSHSGFQFGDTPHYEVGEKVLVIFEGGNSDIPAVIGGWITNASNVHDDVVEHSVDVTSRRKRWVRTDRAGNSIEMCESPGEFSVTISSGGASVRVSQMDNGITLSAEGPVRISASQACIEATQSVIVSDDIFIQAKAADGKVSVFSANKIEVYALTVIEEGQYVDATGIPHQTPLQRLAPTLLELGTITGGLPTLNVNVAALNSFSVIADASINLTTPVITILPTATGVKPRVTMLVDNLDVTANSISFNSPTVTVRTGSMKIGGLV